jgi:hypothetical protein
MKRRKKNRGEAEDRLLQSVGQVGFVVFQLADFVESLLELRVRI